MSAVRPTSASAGAASIRRARLADSDAVLRCLHTAFEAYRPLDTTEPLTQAMLFYEKHGFRRSGKVGNFFGMPLIEYMKSIKSE